MERVRSSSESEQTRKLREQLARKYPKALIFKIADRFTVGVPDFAFIDVGFTLWLELKYYHTSRVAPVFKLERSPQYVTMLRLGEMGIGLYVIYIRDEGATWLSIWKPSTVDRLNSGRFMVHLPPTACNRTEVINRFEEIGAVCVDKNSNPDPLMWIFEHMRSLRCK